MLYDATVSQEQSVQQTRRTPGFEIARIVYNTCYFNAAKCGCSTYSALLRLKLYWYFIELSSDKFWRRAPKKYTRQRISAQGQSLRSPLYHEIASTIVLDWSRHLSLNGLCTVSVTCFAQARSPAQIRPMRSALLPIRLALLSCSSPLVATLIMGYFSVGAAGGENIGGGLHEGNNGRLLTTMISF